MSNLANTLGDQGNLDEAAAMQKEVLEKMTRILGEEHPHIISVMNNLAAILSDQGRLNEAASMQQEVLEKMHLVLGHNDPNTTLTMRKLTILLDSKSRQEFAGSRMQALERWQAHVSPRRTGSLHSCDYAGREDGIPGTIRDELVKEYQQIQDSSSRFVEFQLAWDIPAFRSQECSNGQRLGSVLVLTGDGLNVQAATCASYMNDHWPHIGDPLIDAIDELLSSDKDYIDSQYQCLQEWRIELILLLIVSIDQLRICLVQKTKSAQKGIEFATVCCFAQNNMILDLIDVLTWLCASLRTSLSEEPSVSYALLRKDFSRHTKFYISLAELQSNMTYLGTCWYALIRRSVIADGFPIPARNGEKGVELPLEVMMAISRIFTTAIVDGKYYLVGVSTALAPTQRFGNESLQWHFIQSSPKRISPTDLRRMSILSTIEFGEEITTPDMLFRQLSKRRHFLGWCESSQITIGTNIGTYTPRFTDAREPSNSIKVQNIGATVGTPGMGIFSAVLTANFTLSSTRAEQDQMGSLRFESILLSARRLPYIVFDIDTKRAWLVPAICVILHMVHLRTRKEHNTSKAPYAQTHWDGGEAAYRIMIEHRRKSFGFGDRGSSYTLEDMVREIWLGLISCPQRSATKRPLRKDILYAYELMDIVTMRKAIRLKQVKIDDTGGWIDLTKTVQLVLICREIGEVVSIYPTDARTCWSTVPAGNYLLCATIECLKALSEDIGGAPHNLVQGREWHCSGSLFEACVSTDAGVCNRLQQLVRPGKARTPPQPFSPSGAVIFGKSLKFSHPHPSCPSSTDSQSPDAHEASTSAGGPESRADGNYQQYESIARFSPQSMSSRASSHQNSSIYSLGVNPRLLHDGIKKKSHRTNIAFYRNFSVLE